MRWHLPVIGETSHEHAFFLESDGKLGNQGFFKEGLREDDLLDDLSKLSIYTIDEYIQLPSRAVFRKLSQDVGEYNWLNNNCHDYAELVRSSRSCR